MTLPRVLRLRRSDAATDDSVLIHVSQAGPLALDVRLIATEGDYPYVGSTQQSQINQLRAKNYHGTEKEWENILSSVLIGEARTEDGVEVITSVKSEEITISFRHSIGGIAQRLGTISLRQDKAQEIELFDWTCLAAQAASAAEERERSLLEKLDQQAEAVKQLRVQLEELLKAKEEHETVLLLKFRDLLNRKKLKIRDQQRLLNGADIDTDKATYVAQTRGSGRSRRPGSSRPGKRKSRAAPSEGQDAHDGSSTDDDEAIDGSPDKASPNAEMEEDPQETPPPSDQETADEDDDAFEAVVAPPSQGKGKLFEPKTVPKAQHQQPPDKVSPPPRRDLPFAAKSAGVDSGAPKASQLEEANPDAEETEGEFEDDEL